MGPLLTIAGATRGVAEVVEEEDAVAGGASVEEEGEGGAPADLPCPWMAPCHWNPWAPLPCIPQDLEVLPR